MAFVPSSTDVGLGSTSQSRSPRSRGRDDPATIRDREQRDDPGGRVARRGVNAETAIDRPPSTAAASSAWTKMGAIDGMSFLTAARVRREQRPAHEEHELRKELQDEKGCDESAEPGEGVVGSAKRAREVERQDPVPLVAPEQLRCLGRAEQDDDRRDRREVRVVADRRVVGDAPARTEPQRQRQDADDRERRQDRQPAEEERRDLGSPPRPMPSAVRRLCMNSDRTAWARPSRGPS